MIKDRIKDDKKSAVKKVTLRKPSDKQRLRGILVKAKKKTAVARARIKKGSGRITINKRNLNVFEPEYVAMLISEPLRLAGSLSKQVDIDVNVRGSGNMSQAISARCAIAKALLQYSADRELKQRFINYDRMLLVDDPRRKEAKKPLGKRARSKKQKSKR